VGWAAQDGGLHILMNIVGSNELQVLPNVDLDAWNTVFEINLTGPLMGIQTCAPLMRDSGGGSIIGVLVVAGAAVRRQDHDPPRGPGAGQSPGGGAQRTCQGRDPVPRSWSTSSTTAVAGRSEPIPRISVTSRANARTV
jgi:NAD(P)-dependent dehydrogenase (short-subunit alcohol dehydrogenase family)